MPSATVPAALAIGSMAATAAGSIASGYATSSADKANAQIATNNATLAKQNATFAGEEGEAQAGIEGQKTRQGAGSLKANQGASGVDINTGSNANVQASQAMLGQTDMMNIRSNAARQAYGFNTAASGDLNQASIDRSEGHNAIASGYIGGATKAIAEGASAASAGAFSGASSNLPSSTLLSEVPVDSAFTNQMANQSLQGAAGGFLTDY